MDGAEEQALLVARVARLEQQLTSQSEALTALRNELENLRPKADSGFLRPRKPVAAVAPGPFQQTAPSPAAQASASPFQPAPATLASPVTAIPSFGAPIKSEQKRSLENRIGSQLFNRIGIVALLIAVAWFLKLAVDNQWIHPTARGRVITGLLLGTGIVLWSERFRRKGYPAFSYSLKAVGTGTLYLALWASFHLYHLLPAPLALVLMIAVTAWNATMAWLQDAELLAVYALVGGFATPGLLGSGGNHVVFLFTYVLAMELAVLFLISRKPWQRLLLGSFPATAIYFIGWYSSYWTPPQAGIVVLFALLLAAPMVAAALIGQQRDGVSEGVLAPIGGAAFLSLALYSVLEDSGRHSWLPWLAVLLAAFYLLLMRIRRNGVAEAVHLVLAITFLTVAIPLKASGRWITIGWLVEGVALVWVAALVFGSEVAPRVRTVVRRMGCAALALGVGESLVFWYGQDATSAFWNGRFATEMAAVAALALTGWFTRRAANSTRAPVAAVAHTPSWVAIALIAIPATHLLAALAIVRETVAYWSVGPADTTDLRNQLSELDCAAVMLLYGAALIAWTIYRIPTESTRRTILRWLAAGYEAVGFLFMLGTPLVSNAMSGQVLWNSTAFFEVIGLAALAASVALAWREAKHSHLLPPPSNLDPNPLSSNAPRNPFWFYFAAAGFIAFNLLALFSGVHEILTYFGLHPTTNSGLAESVTISAWMMLYAAALLAVGFVRRMAFIRWQGLVLLVFTVGKVFLYDTRNLTSVYRVLSFMCLGILLMAVSFAYQKDWLSLRDSEDSAPAPTPEEPRA